MGFPGGERNQWRKDFEAFLLACGAKPVSTKDSSSPEILFAVDEYTRSTYSRDLWPKALLKLRQVDSVGQLRELESVDCVIWPRTQQALSSWMRTLVDDPQWKGKVMVIPYGAGSGVCGGAHADSPGDSKSPDSRLVVVVDLKRIDQIWSLDEESQIAHVGAGIMGQVLEDQLNGRGFTMGHFPSSIYCSTLGGYLATRAAGQMSTLYGTIEDVVQAVEGVFPDGSAFQTPLAPKTAVGAEWRHLLLGSEGTLGFFTGAHVKIHPLAENRIFLAFKVASTEKGLDGIRRWLQRGYRPAVVRLYDEKESRLLHGFSEGCKLIAVVEGAKELAEFTGAQLESKAKRFAGWEPLGSEPAEHWWSHRYDISYRQQQILSHRQMILDTFEVSTSWAQLPALHRGIQKVVDEFGGREMLVLIAHFSHFYHTGGNIYFTLCGRAESEAMSVDFYQRVWDALLRHCASLGGALSHHHGLGRLKGPAFARHWSVLFEKSKAVKHALDPENLFNSSNLGF